MKLKHLAAGFVFLTSFLLSILIAGIPARECTAYKNTPVQKQTIRQADTELQVRIRKFLETDRQTGRELSEDLTHFRKVTSEMTAQELATILLVKKMKAVDCVNLPSDFCAAWKDHVEAWSKKDEFQRQGSMSNRMPDNTRNADYSKLSSEISRTYYKMLGVAEKYEVYFSY